MNRLIMFILGVLLTSIGNMFLLIYLNLLTMGYSFLEYVNFIIRRYECYFSVIGLILIIIALKGKEIYGILQRYNRKF